MHNITEESFKLFVDDFFSMELISDKIRDDYYECFKMKYKKEPSEIPKQFRDFVLKEAEKDNELRQFVTLEMKKEEKETLSFIKKESDALMTGEDDGIQRRIPFRLIYSVTAGPDAPANMYHEYQSKKKFERSNCINPTLGSVNGNITDLLHFIDIEIINSVPSENTNSENEPRLYQFVDGNMEAYSQSLSNRVELLIKRIISSCESNFRDDDDSHLPIVTVGQATQIPSLAFGRVTSDSEGRITEQSLMLEGTYDQDGGRTAQLLTRHLCDVFLVEGQVIGVRCTAETEGAVHKISAKRIYPGVLPLPSTDTKLNIHISDAKFNSSSVKMIVLCGPFCDNNSLDYSRLIECLQHVIATDPPHVILLLGPFLDSSNTLVSSGDLKTQLNDDNNSQSWVTYDSLYSSLGSEILKHTANKCHVILQPHTNDVLHPYPLPQPPFDISIFNPNDDITHTQALRRWHMASNPAIIKINGIKIAVTSNDPITPTASSTYSRNQTRDMFNLFCEHVMNQHSFFPVEPCPYPVEPSRIRDLLFDEYTIPDMLIFPVNKMRPFAKVIHSDKVFVNCGQVGPPSNVFVEVYIEPSKWKSDSPIDIEDSSISQMQTRLPVNIQERCRVDLVRIQQQT